MCVCVGYPTTSLCAAVPSNTRGNWNGRTPAPGSCMNTRPPCNGPMRGCCAHAVNHMPSAHSAHSAPCTYTNPKRCPHPLALSPTPTRIHSTPPRPLRWPWLWVARWPSRGAGTRPASLSVARASSAGRLRLHSKRPYTRVACGSYMSRRLRIIGIHFLGMTERMVACRSM